MYKCNINFESKYAKIGDTVLSIDDYLNHGYENKPKLHCVPHGHELISVECTTRKSHFRHKYQHDVDASYPMTQWHSEWQSNFPVTERPFQNKSGQLKDRRADVVIPNLNRILEIQHSKINSGEVNERIKDYKLHEHNVYWLIDYQNSIRIKKINERIVLEFTSNYWLYENFLSCEAVYYDINGFIYKLNPSQVRSHQIDVCEPKIKSEFIEEFQNDKDFWTTSEIPQSYLYVKQKGAGSGKTYGMIQLLNDDPEITNFKWIIFLTKQHSAVNVMYKEFLEQYMGKDGEPGILNNIKFHEEPKMTKDGKHDETQYLTNKRYIIKYNHKITNVDTCVIFGTVDGFANSVGQSNKNACEYFQGIISSIKEGFTKINKSGGLQFANNTTYINKESILMMDETQDLSENYAEAFLKIVKSTHTNLCVVGDKLQSLTHANNAHTFLQSAEMSLMKVIKSEVTNIVRRFSDPKLINFVNSIVPYSDYDLPKMVEYNKVDTKENALTIFSAKTVYANQNKNDDLVVKEVEQIMNYYRVEVEDNKCLPEDFLIVTPFTSKNPLIEALQLAINEYWNALMENNTEYINNVKMKNSYWMNVDTNKYTRYAIFHKSQEMGSINLNDSVKATRIVSIHSSKGDGRKVVFVIGVTQTALQLFSQTANNIIYNSLLHVAVTRQKERLYFRLEENGDDIHMRVKKSNMDINPSNKNFDYPNYKTNISRISDKLLKTSFELLQEKMLSKQEFPKFPKNSDEKLLIDMGDHNIRFASMLINVMIHNCNYELKTKQDTKQQTRAILRNLKADIVKPVTNWRDYTDILLKNSDRSDKSEKTKKYIPVLQINKNKTGIDYDKYFSIIINTMFRIISELNYIDTREINYFCPLESVILYYMIESTESGKYQKITINDVYNIIDVYKKAFDNTASGHEHCRCKEFFSNTESNNNATIEKNKKYLCNHYDRINHLTKLLNKFIESYPSISWLYNHSVKYTDGGSSEFEIYKHFRLIGYDKTNVYILNLKPQFNDMNLNSSYVDSITDSWLISNISKDSPNYPRFNGKKLISCFLSLDKDDIYQVEWDNFNEHNVILTKQVYNTIKEMYSNKHEQYYNTFINICQEKLTYKDAFKYCIDEDTCKMQYICDFWKVMLSDIERCYTKKEKNEKFKDIQNKDTFIKSLDGFLDRSLKKYFQIEDEDEDDEE